MRRTLLLGHPRSGTTLLRRLLNAHPAIVAPPETHLFGACARFLAAEETADGVDMGVLAGLHYAGFDDAVVIERLRSLAFGFMDEIATRHGVEHWVEKTAFDVFQLSGIEQLCGSAVRYVGIIRHPLDVAASCIDFTAAAGTYHSTLHAYICRFPQPIEAFARSWIDATEALIELGNRRPEQVLICRYEDLVSEPEATIRDVLAFIGEDDDPTLVGRALGDIDELGFSDHKSYQVDQVHEASVSRWHSIPSPQVARLAELLAPYLDTCGYDPLPNSGAASTDQARARYTRSLAVHATKRTSS